MSEEFNPSMKYEHFITPDWAVKAILTREILTREVVDPCSGTGVLGLAAIEEGYSVNFIDIHDWGNGFNVIADFLGGNSHDLDEYIARSVDGSTVLMNPPFSKAVDFVKRAFSLGARKVVCFQRFSWWESQDRDSFWKEFPPNRIYICGDRASCWRYDLPKDKKGNRFDPITNKKLAQSPTAHAWFVWEAGNPSGTVLGHIWKSDVEGRV